MNNTLIVRDMTAAEAETAIEQINNHAGEIRRLLRELKERRGYHALGYTSFESFCQERLNITRRTGYRQIQAGIIDETLMCPVGHTPERVARELATLHDPIAIRLAYTLAERQAVILQLPNPTAEITRAAVNTVKQIEETGGDVNLDGNLVPALTPITPTAADGAVTHELNEIHADDKQRAVDHMTPNLVSGHAKQIINVLPDGRLVLLIPVADAERIRAAQMRNDISVYYAVRATPKKSI